MISMSKIIIKSIYRRRGYDEVIQIHRRHGFGENTEEGSDAAELIVNNQNWFQIATTVKWKYNCAVLGLAACHVSQNCNEKMQVRPAGQAGYPISLVAVPVKCCVPLQISENQWEVLHLFRWYTHTNTHTCVLYTCIYCVYIYIYIHGPVFQPPRPWSWVSHSTAIVLSPPPPCGVVWCGTVPSPPPRGMVCLECMVCLVCLVGMACMACMVGMLC